MASPTPMTDDEAREQLAQQNLQLLRQRIAIEQHRGDELPSRQGHFRKERENKKEIYRQLDSQLQHLADEQQVLSSQLQRLNTKLLARRQARAQYSYTLQGSYRRPYSSSSSFLRATLPQTLLTTLQTQQTLLHHLSDQLSRAHGPPSPIKARNLNTHRVHSVAISRAYPRTQPVTSSAAQGTTWHCPHCHHDSSVYIGAGPLITSYHNQPSLVQQESDHLQSYLPRHRPETGDPSLDNEGAPANHGRPRRFQQFRQNSLSSSFGLPSAFRYQSSQSREPPLHPALLPREKFRRVLLAVAACQRLWIIRRRAKQRRLERRIDRALGLMGSYFKQKSRNTYQSIHSVTGDEATKLMQPRQSSFSLIFRRLSSDQHAALSELSSAVESIVEEICELTPTSPGLRHHVPHCLWMMMQNRTPFPPNYLWQAEKERLPLDHLGQLEEASNRTAAILVLGFVLGRGLLTNLLFEPVQSGLFRQLKGEDADNVKVLATVLFYICRLAMSNCATPTESSSLFRLSSTQAPVAVDVCMQSRSALLPDADISFYTNKHSRLYSTLQTQLTDWAVGFVQALHTNYTENT